jgi:ketosteroid isomerase-like protein
MKGLLALLVVIAAVGAWGCSGDNESSNTPASATPTVSSPTAIEETITKLEHDWVAAIMAKDVATIEKLLADEFVGTTNDRRYVKKDAIHDVQMGTHELLTLEDVQVRVFGDAAIVDVDQVEKSRHDGEDFSGTYLFTNVWVKQSGEWRAVASHGSRVR